MQELLVAIGDEPSRPELAATPTLVAEMLATQFAGVGMDPRIPLADVAQIDPPPSDVGCDRVRLMRPLRFRSICEHHLLPFRGTAHIAYLPSRRETTWEAILRALDALTRRPQVQERLGEQLADELTRALEPSGVLIKIDAEHECVTMRGGRQTNARMTTIVARGVYIAAAARAYILAAMVPASPTSRVPTERPLFPGRDDDGRTTKVSAVKLDGVRTSSKMKSSPA